ncbi:MAG TPA: EAL domain-containing protein [Pseudomonadales bacterium]|nr:EAL domain-containing protein [Pseudomonadales bacterium]
MAPPKNPLSPVRTALKAVDAKEYERLQLALLASRDGIWDWCIQSDQVYYSPRWLEILGYQPDEFPPHLHEWQQRLHPRDADQVLQAMQAHIAGTQPHYQISYRLRARDGRYRWVLARGQVLYDMHDVPVRMVGTITDITGYKQMQRRLQVALEVLRQFSDNLIVIDQNFLVVATNSAFQRNYGYAQETLLGHSPAELLAEPLEAAAAEQLRSDLATQGQWAGELWTRTQAGERILQWVKISAIHVEAQAAPTLHAIVFSPLSNQPRIQERLQRLAYYDHLTGLPNRELFHDRLTVALRQAQRHGEQVALLFFDLNRFKNINDTLGHTMGDLLLQQVAQRLERVVRVSDTVARLGGDEFTMILTGLHQPNDLQRVMDEVLGQFRQPFRLGEHELFVTTSVGVSLFPRDGEDEESLIKNADIAMYRAKEQGSNSYQIYSPEFGTRFRQRLTLEADLRKALERNELLLHYQPKIDVNSRRITGIEALLRWQHPTRGLVPPDQFIPIAEETGLILPIGDWVLRKGMEDALPWVRQSSHPFTLAVNLSPVQLQQPDLVQRVARMLDDSGFNPRHLELELTENLLMTNPKASLETLQQLTATGVRIAIDDFGTGYSSLNYLSRFPIDTLKIDKSFIHDLLDDFNNAEIVSTIVAMGHNLNMTVVAEGVESEAQLAYLRDIGCDEAQGFLFSRPIDRVSMELLLVQQADLRQPML